MGLHRLMQMYHSAAIQLIIATATVLQPHHIQKSFAAAVNSPLAGQAVVHMQADGYSLRRI